MNIFTYLYLNMILIKSIYQSLLNYPFFIELSFSGILFSSYLISFTFKNPLMLGLMVISQALVYAVFMVLKMSFTWFSYLLFLVYIGGILMIFSYMISISINTDSKWVLDPMYLNGFSLSILTLLFLTLSMKEIKMKTSRFMIKETMMIENKVFSLMSDSMMFFNLFLMSFLLLIMIIVVFVIISSKSNSFGF